MARQATIPELEQEQKSWISAKEAKKATNCNTRAELEDAISKQKDEIASLSSAIASVKLKKRLEHERELTRLESFLGKMPSLEHLKEWVSKLEKEILASKNDTEQAIALAEQLETILPRLKLEEEAAAKLGIHPKESTNDRSNPSTPRPPQPSAPEEEEVVPPVNANVNLPPANIPIAHAVPYSNSSSPEANGCCVVL